MAFPLNLLFKLHQLTTLLTTETSLAFVGWRVEKLPKPYTGNNKS
jgi:hypothetical protein